MFNFFKRRPKDPRDELRGLLGEYEVVHFPSTVMSVLSTLRDPDSTTAEIAEKIEVDPGLHVQVLRITNSAAYGLSSKVSSIRHAVTLLGRARLESLVLSHGVARSLPSDGSSCIDITQFWINAARRASLTRFLAQRLHPATQAESFTLGLLQNMALPVLAQFKKDAYSKVYENYVQQENGRLDLLEQEAFGYDHAGVGALMSEVWSFPDNLTNGIAGHHDWDAKSGVTPAVRLASLARFGDECDGDGLALFCQICQSEFAMEDGIIDEALAQADKDAEGFAESVM